MTINRPTWGPSFKKLNKSTKKAYIFQTQQNSALSNLTLNWAINKNEQSPNAFLLSYAATAAADPKGQQAGEMVGWAQSSTFSIDIRWLTATRDYNFTIPWPQRTLSTQTHNLKKKKKGYFLAVTRVTEESSLPSPIPTTLPVTHPHFSPHNQQMNKELPSISTPEWKPTVIVTWSHKTIHRLIGMTGIKPGLPGARSSHSSMLEKKPAASSDRP